MAYLTRQQTLDIINKAPSNLNKELLLKELAKTNTIEGYNEPEKKSSFLKDIGREIVKPFAQSAELLGSGVRALGGTIKAGTQLATGNKEAAKKTILETAKRAESRPEIKVLGETVSRVETPKQVLGTALNLASNLIGGGGVAKAGTIALKSGLKSVIKTGAVAGAKAGALYGAGEALSEDRNVLLGVAKGALGGAIGGAAIPALGSATIGTAKVLTSPFTTAIEKIAPKLEMAAQKIETTVLKPSKTDLQHGFKIENISKYDLGGSLKQSYDKTQSLIDDLVSKAESMRASSKAQIDLNKIVSSVADELSTGKVYNIGNNKRIFNAFKTFVKELEDVAPNGKVNTVDAQKIKVALGKMGSWLNGARDLDANATETIANSLYTKFKTAIENAVDDPKELQVINKQLSELIPIQNVIVKRIPVAERNSALSLTDIITAGAGTIDPKAWGLFALNRLSKSGQFANILQKGATKLKSGATKLLPLETKLKNIKPGLTIEDVSKKPLVSKTDNLIQEAKKYKSAEEFVKSQIKKEYRSPHQINPAETISLNNVNVEKLKSAMKEKKGWLNNYDLKDLKKLNSFVDNPEKEITIFRTSPKNELNPGDWVTADRVYANDIKRQNGGRVYSYTVKVKDLRLPNNVDTLPSASMASAFQYNPNVDQLIDIWNKAQKLK